MNPIRHIFLGLFLLGFMPKHLLAQGFLPGMKLVGGTSLVLDYDFANTNSYSGTGTTVYNLVNPATTASLVNGPTYFSTPGYTYLDGVNDYLQTENLAPYFSQVGTGVKNTTFTTNLWFNPKSNNGVIIQEMGQATPNTGYHYASLEMVNGSLKFSVYGATYTALVSTSTLTLHNWYHVAMTYDGVNFKGYLNGALIGTAAISRVSSLNTTGSLYYALGAADFTNMGSGVAGKFLLSKFSIYNSCLNATDITSLYDKQKANFQNLALITLDAANRSSYPGSGTVWNDVSGNANHISLGNTTYNSTLAGGSIYLDGTAADYLDFECGVGALNSVTIEMWVNTLSLQNGMYMGWGLYDVWTSGGTMGYNTGSGDVYGISAAQVTSLGVVNSWKHLVFVMNKSNYVTNKIYVNGVLQSMAQQASTQNAAQTTFNSGLGRIGCWRNDTNYPIKMNLSTFSIYPNELSAASILQKYTNTKSRYGL